jgi:hypothetical protein
VGTDRLAVCANSGSCLIGISDLSARNSQFMVPGNSPLATFLRTTSPFRVGRRIQKPKWTAEGVSGHEKIVLHVSVLQAGEDLMMLRLGYSVTATGYLRNPTALVP